MLAAEILHALRIDLEQGGGGGFFAAGAAQGGVEVGDFDLFHFGVEVHATFGDQNGLLPAGAMVEQELWQVLGGDDRAGDHHHQALNDVFQFANIARPMVFLEDFEDLGLECLQTAFWRRRNRRAESDPPEEGCRLRVRGGAG